MMTLAMMLGTVALAAQEPQCNTLNPNATAACNTAVDAVKAFHPLAGMLVSGGNPVLGTAGSLGGAGHLSLTARVNLIKAALPNPDSASQPTVPSSFNGAIPAPVVEAGLGLYRGTTLGLLSIDALGSAVLLPTGVVSNLSVDSGAAHIGSVALGLGYGVRVGVLKGSFPVPSVSVSYMRRNVPRIQYGDLASGNLFEFDTDLKADNYRVEAGWRFVLLDLAAGLGIDHYTSTAHIRFHDTPTTVRTVTLDLANSRQVAFLDAGLSLALVKLVGEVGYQTGKDQKLTTNFSDFDPKAGHVFGGLGIRFGF
ncbi:MAG TPA: hypothetical protein VGV12_08820 [Gemmatimonadales bacterium]|nr:hypothetical protein [Gemmatimonadales bacterium]